MRSIDLIGKRFGRLVALHRGENKNEAVRLTCRCDCGTELDVRALHLKNGISTSCGCWKLERLRQYAQDTIKHGDYGSRTYKSWIAMHSRCYNPNRHERKYYRGITVCDRWRGENGYANFLTDMGERPIGKSLDRYPDPDGNYTPDNCRWATPVEQRHNWRPTAQRRVRQINQT